MNHIIRQVQINIPFHLLHRNYLPVFLEKGLNPEIGFDASSLDSYSVGEVQSIAEALLEAGLSTTLHGPFMDLSPGSPDPAVRSLTRRRFEQFLQWAPLFKPKSVVFHAGYDHRRYGFMQEMWLEKSLEIWSWLACRLEDWDIPLMIENVYERSPADLLPLLEQLEERQVGFCLDTGHQAAFSQAPLMEWAEGLGAYLGQLHLHDNLGQEDSHWALGRGSVEFPHLFKYIKEKGGNPIVTLEPHKEEDLWPSLEYLQKARPW